MAEEEKQVGLNIYTHENNRQYSCRHLSSEIKHIKNLNMDKIRPETL